MSAREKVAKAFGEVVETREITPVYGRDGRVTDLIPGPIVRTAAQEGGGFVPPHKREVAAPAQRKIPANHAFDPKAIKPLVKMLWATSVALGHTLTAHRQFSRLKSVAFSPDGMVGGRGYVMGVKDVRAKLYEASEHLSTICDAIYDEINGEHWKPKLADLEKRDMSEVKKLLSDATDYLEDPEGEAEEDMSEVEDGPAPEHEPAAWAPDRYKNEEDPSKGSKMPRGGGPAKEQGPQPARQNRPSLTKQSSVGYGYDRRANSSVNVDSLPGPRVNHLDRGEQTGPFGSYNREESLPTGDQWSRDEGAGDEYNYPSAWENDFSGKSAKSNVPDANTDRTPTEAWDFGIGRGNGDDAHGQGAGGYGEANPSSGGRGVYGPRSGLPNDPGGKTRDDTSDSTAITERATSGMGMPVMSSALLPLDVVSPVARSDYYAGPKGNDFNGVVGESNLPGDGGGASYNSQKAPGPNLGYKYERPDVPYVKYDYNTPQMRPDWMNQRPPLQGPYKK